MKVLKALGKAYFEAGGNEEKFILLVMELADANLFTAEEIKEAEEKLQLQEKKREEKRFRYGRMYLIGFLISIAGLGLVGIGGETENTALAYLGFFAVALGFPLFLYFMRKEKEYEGSIIEEAEEAERLAYIETGLSILKDAIKKRAGK